MLTGLARKYEEPPTH